MARMSVDKSPLPYIRDLNTVSGLVWDGKVFGVANVAVGTGITGGTTAYSSFLPTFSFRNLGSKVMIPLFGTLTQTGSVSDARIHVHVSTLETAQVPSAGTAISVFNRNQNSSLASGVLATHTNTYPAFTTGNQKLRFALDIFQTVTTVGNPRSTSIFPYPGFTMVRPGGSMEIYTVGSSTAPTWYYDIQWAELET